MQLVFEESFRELRSRISKVGYTENGIKFFLDEKEYTGELKGRNTNLVLGLSTEHDTAIALRVLLDGHANILDAEEWVPFDFILEMTVKPSELIVTTKPKLKSRRPNLLED